MAVVVVVEAAVLYDPLEEGETRGAVGVDGVGGRVAVMLPVGTGSVEYAAEATRVYICIVCMLIY